MHLINALFSVNYQQMKIRPSFEICLQQDLPIEKKTTLKYQVPLIDMF